MSNRELLLRAAAPKSDQLNAEDMLAGPKVITITGVKVSASPEQPVWIHFQGDNNKPWKPCKTMMRVMMKAWGDDPDQWAGKSAQLYCDPEVVFGKDKVGGIRISHLSHIDQPIEAMLLATRGKRKPYRVDVLRGGNQQQNQQQQSDPRVYAQQLKNAALNGSLALEQVWAQVPMALRDPKMQAWYQEQCATAASVDAQSSFEPVAAPQYQQQETEHQQQYTDAAGVEDM